VKLEGPDTLLVLFRVENRRVERIRMFSEGCELDAGGRPVRWLENVRPAESVALLESLAPANAEKRDRIASGAISALAMHAAAEAGAALQRMARTHQAAGIRGESLFWLAQRGDQGADRIILEAIEKDASADVRKRAVFALSQLTDGVAVPALIRVARTDATPTVRGEALFWLGQKAGKKAAAEITERIEQDPDTDVKKRAVFALSQLPKDEGVPLLITVARTNTNPAVRKQAMFWLGQSKDPRAIDFFAEILK
jgi:HEAT repeat protein